MFVQLPETMISFSAAFTFGMLPKEIREKIVTTPWIKHLNLYICKEWYNFIYDNLPDVELEQYIRERDYFSIMYIRLNFKYKFKDLDNIDAAIEVNDSFILNMMVNYIGGKYNHSSYQDRMDVGKKLIYGVIRNNNYKVLKNPLIFNICNIKVLDIYNEIVESDHHWNSKCLNLILQRSNRSLFGVDIIQLKDSLSSSFDRDLVSIMNDNHTINEKCYFECIRHDYFSIIKSFQFFEQIHNSKQYHNLLFSLALSGTSKYTHKYRNSNTKLTEKIITSMNLQDRYNKIMNLKL